MLGYPILFSALWSRLGQEVVVGPRSPSEYRGWTGISLFLYGRKIPCRKLAMAEAVQNGLSLKPWQFCASPTVLSNLALGGENRWVTFTFSLHLHMPVIWHQSRAVIFGFPLQENIVYSWKMLLLRGFLLLWASSRHWLGSKVPAVQANPPSSPLFHPLLLAQKELLVS